MDRDVDVGELAEPELRLLDHLIFDYESARVIRGCHADMKRRLTARG